MELVLGSFNGVMIQGKKPRRPKMRKVVGGRAPLVLKPPDSPPPTVSYDKPPPDHSEQQTTTTSPVASSHSPKNSNSISPIHLYSPDQTQPVVPFRSPPQQMLQVLVQMLQNNGQEHWSIEQLENSNYRIHLHSIRDMDRLLHLLQRFSTSATSNVPVPFPSLINPDHQQQLSKWNPVRLPYIRYHSELYPKTVYAPPVDWPPFHSLLPLLLDNCVHTFITCMNHYFPVRPKNFLIAWYSSLADPETDPLVLSIASFWVRHVFIHHPMPQVQHLYDHDVLDAVQLRLGRMARQAITDCFDEPHVHTVYALCLCNGTTVIPTEQKVTNHMLAARMAAALDIRPIPQSETADDPEMELKARLWWYLFQIDHFLVESNAIPHSMLQPASDDSDELTLLRRPTPCAFDNTDEIPGVHCWNNTLKLWLIRRRLSQQMDTIDPSDEPTLASLYNHGLRSVDQWQRELPNTLQQATALNTEHFAKFGEACLTVSMERCTNVGLLSLRLLPTDGRVLTGLQRRALFNMIDSATELITIRQSVMSSAHCQTWPGNSLRSIKMLMSCLYYGDPDITGRSRIGLMRAARMLRSMAEVRWKDPVCTQVLLKIEQLLASETPETLVSLNDDDDSDDPDISHPPSTSTAPPPSPFIPPAAFPCSPPSTVSPPPAARHQPESAASSRFIPTNGHEKRSIKIANNLYEGVVLLDRDMQPRAQFYNPNASTDDCLDSMLLFEDGRH